jgi:hypothetical protein
MATRKKPAERPSVRDIVEELAEQFANGNKGFVKKQLVHSLPPEYVPIVTLRIYDLLYNPDDTYLASSFMRFVESFTIFVRYERGAYQRIPDR